MLRGYETLVITHPEATEEELQVLTEKAKNVITKSKGECIRIDNWGKKKLVYRIKGLAKGNYLIFYFRGTQPVLKDLDALLRYNERVLRYQTVKLAENFDFQSLQSKKTVEQVEVAETQPSEAVTAHAPTEEAPTETVGEEPVA